MIIMHDMPAKKEAVTMLTHGHRQRLVLKNSGFYSSRNPCDFSSSQNLGYDFETTCTFSISMPG